MPYDPLTSRTDAGALIPEDAAKEIFASAAQSSVFMRSARRLRDATTAQTRLPVLSALPTAYFVNGDTGLKQTTEGAWKNVYVNIEEIACIAPVPENVLADSSYDIWGELRPYIAEAIGVAFDAAAFLGANAPATWPSAIVTAAAAAANSVDLSDVVAGGGDLYDAIMGATGSIALLEADGYFPTGHVAPPLLRGKLRGLRSATEKIPLLTANAVPGAMVTATQYALDGTPIDFALNGALDSASVLLISADWRQFVYSVRQDITFKVLSEAVIQDSTGAIVYNLAQQDMVALRCVIRVGWAVPNPINRMQGVEASRYPASVLVP